ncbi:MAG: hypothetical protein Q9190_005811 [Brigantiaea leucoxantha]
MEYLDVLVDPPNAECNLDIIFVHGLNPTGDLEHARKTWTHENGTFWPETLLPELLPSARILLFAYNSSVLNNASNVPVAGHAQSLLNDVKNRRLKEREIHRPLIFVAHSLGGLLVKQALIEAKLNEPRYGSLKASTYGLVFFATPHAGGNKCVVLIIDLDLTRYDCVFWIDASSRDTLEQSFRNEAIRIGATSNKKISLTEALRELELYQGRWLLLFDGADNLEEISGLFPPGIHGDIIYTSRNQMLRRLPVSQMRHVSEMDYEEALELLLKSAHLEKSSKDYQVQALAIVAELGYLALAVDQAGAYIASGECYLDDFVDVFNAHRQRLLGNEAYRGASGSDRAVYATWELSFAAIDRQVKAATNEALCEGPRAALEILQVFPFFHNEDIMEEIFRFAAENPNDLDQIEDGKVKTFAKEFRYYSLSP